MKKFKLFGKLALISSLLLGNTLTGVSQVFGETTSEESSYSELNTAEEISAPSNLQRTAESTVENTETSTSQAEEVAPEKAPVTKTLVNPYLDDPYFPSEPSQKDLDDALIEPGQIPLAEFPSLISQVGSSYSYSANLSNNNSQIIRYQHANIAQQYKAHFPKFGYAEGIGKPRGIVIHETANPNSTIWSEINFMSGNYKNAFVQAFADANNIIEIHPTDYAARGSGKNANPYFVQIELVEHGNKTDFYKSVNNQAYYAAHMLKRYNLVPSRASGTKGNPQGTIWGHFEVSSLLGGTNHSDPVGYFAKYGYSFNEFFELVQYHYNKLSYSIITDEQKVTSKALVKTAEDVYSKPSNTIESVKVGSTANNVNQYLTISKKATTNDNRIFYYVNELKGYISDQSVSLYDGVDYTKPVNFLAVVRPIKEAGVHGLYNGIFNTSGEIQNIGNNNAYEGKVVTITTEAKTVRAIWYQFSVDGTPAGWMDSKAFSTFDGVEYYKAVNYNAMVDTAALAGNHGIYSDIFNTKPDIKLVGRGRDFAEKSVKVTKEAKTSRAIWYYFEVDGKEIGWMDSKGIKAVDAVHYNKEVNFFMKILPTNLVKQHWIYEKIYGTSVNNQATASAVDHAGKGVKIIREAKTDKAIWYQFSINGKTIGWMDSRAFEQYDTITEEKTVNRDEKFLSVNDAKKHWIFSEVYNTSPDAKGISDGSRYGNKVVKVVKEAKTSKALWYQISVGGSIIGWIDSRAFVKYDQVTNEKVVNFEAKVLAANEAKKHWIFSGVYFSSPNVKGLSVGTPYASKAVKIIKEATTSKAKWYQFEMDGKTIGWMDSRAFTIYDSIEYQKSVSFTKEIKQGKTHGLYDGVYNTSSKVKNIGTNQPYFRKKVELVAEAKTRLAVWYQFEIDGKLIGWMDSRAFSDVNDPEASFVYESAEIAQSVTKGQDLFPSVMIAQAIVESGYGSSVLGQAPNNNLFGIKGKYYGQSVTKETKEFDPATQKEITIQAEFKKYPNQVTSFEDNRFKLLVGTPWNPNYYREAWRSVAKTPANATKALTGTYATDPKYKDKLNNQITEWNLTQYD